MDYIGRDALQRASAEPLTRQIRGLAIDDAPLPICQKPWPVSVGDDAKGNVTAAAWSPDLGINIAIGMIDASHWAIGKRVEVNTPDGMRPAEIRGLPFI